MSDKPKQASIPAWQKASPLAQDSPASEQSADNSKGSEATITGRIQIEAPSQPAEPESRAEVADDVNGQDGADQVARFLSDPAVASAPVEKKRAFLESKGVTKAMIEQAVGKVTDVKSEEDAPVTFSTTHFQQTLRQPVARQQAPRDVPPVVTYPEFLVQPQKPPPLVTVSRLLNTAYAAAGLSAVFYGLSKYLVAPMTDQLTEARHDMAQHAGEKVKEMNEKLGQIVSAVPVSTKSKIDNGQVGGSDTDSVVSDPTELFHRDFGTQTSPELSRRDSTDSSDTGLPVSTKSVVERQQDRLKIMSSHLEELLSGSNTNGGSNQVMQERVTELREYLDTLLYLPPAQLENGVWQTAPGHDRKKDDAVAAFKAEIRGVKGVLLSAKRFPASSGPAAARVGG